MLDFKVEVSGAVTQILLEKILLLPIMKLTMVVMIGILIITQELSLVMVVEIFSLMNLILMIRK